MQKYDLLDKFTHVVHSSIFNLNWKYLYFLIWKTKQNKKKQPKTYVVGTQRGTFNEYLQMF